MKSTKNKELTAIIKEIKYKYNLIQAEIADKIGISPQYLSDTINGRYPFNDDLKKKISEQFTDILIEGINSDVTPMTASPMEEYTTTKCGIRFLTRQDGKLVMEVPVVPIEALGSPQDEYAAIINEHEGEKALFEVDEVHHGRYLAFKVSGDSMDDGTRHGFEKGDIVLVRELDRDKWMPRLHYNTWPFWVVVFGNCVRIKQIIDQDEHTGAITLHSLNPSPEYTDFTLQLDEINRLFNVVQHIPHPNKF